MITNAELKRLIKITKALGVRIKIVQKTGRYPYAGEYTPSRRHKGLIVIYQSSGISQHDMFLILLHELGHHIDFLIRKKIPDAYYYIDQEYCPRWARRSILNAERHAIQYAEILYHHFEFKFPYWKVKKECAFDYYQYWYFYKNGVWITKRQTTAFLAAWDKKYKKSLVTVK